MPHRPPARDAIWHRLAEVAVGTVLVLLLALAHPAEALQLQDREMQNVSAELMRNIWGATLPNYSWWARECTFLPERGYPNWFWISGLEKDSGQAYCASSLACPGKWKAYEWMRRATRSADDYLDGKRFEDLNKSLCYMSVAAYFIASLQDSGDYEFVVYKVLRYDWSHMNETMPTIDWGCSGDGCNNACRQQIAVNVRRCEERMTVRCLTANLSAVDAEDFCERNVCRRCPDVNDSIFCPAPPVCEVCDDCPPPDCPLCVPEVRIEKQVEERRVEVPVEKVVERLVFRDDCPEVGTQDCQCEQRAFAYQMMGVLFLVAAFFLALRFFLMTLVFRRPPNV